MPSGSFLRPSTRGLHMIQVLQQIQNLLQKTVQNYPTLRGGAWAILPILNMKQETPFFANKTHDKKILRIFACSTGFILAIIFFPMSFILCGNASKV